MDYVKFLKRIGFKRLYRYAYRIAKRRSTLRRKIAQQVLRELGLMRAPEPLRYELLKYIRNIIDYVEGRRTTLRRLSWYRISPYFDYLSRKYGIYKVKTLANYITEEAMRYTTEYYKYYSDTLRELNYIAEKLMELARLLRHPQGYDMMVELTTAHVRREYAEEFIRRVPRELRSVLERFVYTRKGKMIYVRLCSTADLILYLDFLRRYDKSGYVNVYVELIGELLSNPLRGPTEYATEKLVGPKRNDEVSISEIIHKVNRLEQRYEGDYGLGCYLVKYFPSLR